MPPRRPRREPTPFEVIEGLRLADVPRNPAERLLPVSDYEIILAQGYEIASLRRQLEERDASGS